MLARHCHFRGVWHFGQDSLHERRKFKQAEALLSRTDIANPFRIGNVADTLAVNEAFPRD
jgi:hypothetical protein